MSVSYIFQYSKISFFESTQNKAHICVKIQSDIQIYQWVCKTPSELIYTRNRDNLHIDMQYTMQCPKLTKKANSGQIFAITRGRLIFFSLLLLFSFLLLHSGFHAYYIETYRHEKRVYNKCRLLNYGIYSGLFISLLRQL